MTWSVDESGVTSTATASPNRVEEVLRPQLVAIEHELRAHLDPVIAAAVDDEVVALAEAVRRRPSPDHTWP